MFLWNCVAVENRTLCVTSEMAEPWTHTCRMRLILSSTQVFCIQLSTPHWFHPSLRNQICGQELYIQLRLERTTPFISVFLTLQVHLLLCLSHTSTRQTKSLSLPLKACIQIRNIMRRLWTSILWVHTSSWLKNRHFILSIRCSPV